MTNKLINSLEDSLDFFIYAPYSVLKHIWIQLLIIGLMFGLGTLIFMHYQGLDFLTALLGSVSTITTIGIYAPNLVTMPASEKVWLIIIFIVSVGSAASVVQGTVSAAVKKEFLIEELTLKKAKRMKNHVIVMGYKFLGKYIVENLKALELEYIVIVRDSSQIDALRAQGIPAIHAPIIHAFEALRQAGAERACALISTFDEDCDNMLAVLSAKKLNKEIRTITIINKRELAKGARESGADIAVSVHDVLGEMLAISTISKEITGVFLTDRLKSRHIAEFEITTSGIKYGDLKGICPILMVSRKEEVIYDMSNDFQLLIGDFVYALIDNESLKAFREKLKSLSVAR
ncbi:Glutathione-regulated potassium-efflux system protein KefB [uncultured archaeon]|nr:Glutathione-regulated potassium-efflux system protein KefB [uncultured archaeon]